MQKAGKINQSDLFQQAYQQTLFYWGTHKAGFPDFSGVSGFAIITAFNPLGNVISHSENLRRHHALQRRVSGLELQSAKITGCSPDFTHQEEGLAAVTDLDSAILIGSEFEQNAIYYVRQSIMCEQGQLLLVPCKLEKMGRVDLGSFAARVVR